MGGAAAGQVVRGCRWNKTEQVMGWSSISPWQLQFLPPGFFHTWDFTSGSLYNGLWYRSIRQTNPFFSKLLWVIMVLITVIENWTRTKNCVFSRKRHIKKGIKYRWMEVLRPCMTSLGNMRFNKTISLRLSEPFRGFSDMWSLVCGAQLWEATWNQCSQ